MKYNIVFLRLVSHRYFSNPLYKTQKNEQGHHFFNPKFNVDIFIVNKIEPAYEMHWNLE